MKSNLKYFYTLEFLLLSKGSILLMHAYNHAFWVTNTPLKGAGKGILYFFEKWGQTSGLKEEACILFFVIVMVIVIMIPAMFIF